MKNYLSLSILILLHLWILTTGCDADKTGGEAVRLMEQDETRKAINILEGLAAKGDTKAMVQLGIYYYEGAIIKQDYPKAMDWWLKAFDAENADAFVNLGVMHRDGHAVPKNKKIAYCVFLTTHMCGLGSESTQLRSNSCLRRMIEELSKDDIKDCLSNYTPGYIFAYLEAKGKMEGIPGKHKPSEEQPALKDLGWFLDSEIDAIFGPPTEEEKKAREERDRQWEKESAALEHTLVFQIKFPKDSASQYHSYDIITDQGMSSGRIPEKKLRKQDGHLIYEDDDLIYSNHHRYVTVVNNKYETLVFKIDHPKKPSPCDWGKWQKVNYILKDDMDKFTLMQGSEPKSKETDAMVNMPQLRFKVTK